MSKHPVVFIVALGILWAQLGCAQEGVRIVSWNVREVFSMQDVAKRSHQFAQAGVDLAPDILILQEITSQEEAMAIRDAMGLQGFHVACSDFMPDRGDHESFEVAIISRQPFGEVREFDPRPDGKGAGEQHLLAPQALKLNEVSTSRGFLWVTIPSFGLGVAGLHLKSSGRRRGVADLKNARKRERVAAALVTFLASQVKNQAQLTVIAAGDFNVGHGDRQKNGRNLEEDCAEDCGGQDPYDETHALLAQGLLGSFRMKNLAAGIDQPSFPKVRGTPIDNIYVAGPKADDFYAARLGSNTYESDHLPVIAVLPQAAQNHGEKP